jgi:hypothetical protein
VLDYTEAAMSMPCDPDLLPALGRVTWAAARLHYGVRDAINHLAAREGEDTGDAAFDKTLGGVITELSKRAQQLPPPERAALQAWCRDEGHPAAEGRDGVAHAITYTSSDGRQALGGSRPNRPVRYLEPELINVAGRLVAASVSLPQGPYGRPDPSGTRTPTA